MLPLLKLSELKLGTSVTWGAHHVKAYTWGDDPNLIHVGEDFTLSDLGVNDALEISYKPRFKPMKKFRGPKLQKFKKTYRKNKVKKAREIKQWRRANKSNLKRRAKQRHYKKRP